MHIPRIAKSAAFALAILTATQITFAQTDPKSSEPQATGAPQHHHHGPGCDNKMGWEQQRDEMKKKFAQDLDLTPDQQKKIDALHQEYYDAHKTQIDAQKAKYAELCKMKQSGATEAEIHAKMESMPKTDYKAMRADHDKLDQQIRAVLTPEQAKKFDAMKAEHAQRWHEHEGSGGKDWGHHHDEQPSETPPAKP